MNNEKRLVPKLRFPEFTHAWEQRKLEALGDFSAGGDINKEQLSTFGAYPVIANALTNDGIVGYYDHFKYTAPAVTITGRGDIGTAKARYINFTAVVRLLVFQPKPQYDVKFLEEAINLKNIYVESTGVPQLTVPQIKAYEVTLPQPQEQQKIGAFFTALDRYITIHQRKLENVKKLKAGLLQKMFPKNDQEFPEIRFPEFTYAWEQLPFKKLANIRRGLTYKPTDLAETGIRVLRSSNINEDVFLLQDDDVFVDPKAVNIPLVQENEILITSANGSSRLVGKHALIKGAPNSVAGGFMLVTQAKIPSFVNSLMNSTWYSKFINTYVAGGNGAIGNLSKQDLEEQLVQVPSEQEQQKIGTFFTALDRYITIHQRK